MRVSVPLLTLVPGISGGSETYARELCRALARLYAWETRIKVLSARSTVKLLSFDFDPCRPLANKCMANASNEAVFDT